MTERDHQIVEAVGAAYRTDGKAVPSTIYPRLPATVGLELITLKRHILPQLVKRGLLEKLPGRHGYKPKRTGRYCPYCGAPM